MGATKSARGSSARTGTGRGTKILDNTVEEFAGGATGPVGGRGIETVAGTGGGRKVVDGSARWERSIRAVSTALWAGPTSSGSAAVTGYGRTPTLENWRLTAAIVMLPVIISIVSPTGGTECLRVMGSVKEI